MTVVIYHNPRCSKSRATLALLRDRGVRPQVIHYLESPPQRAALKELLAMLDLAPRDLMRKGEPLYKQLALSDERDDETLLAAMTEHPILIERPIVRSDKGAAIGRPPEAVLKIL